MSLWMFVCWVVKYALRRKICVKYGLVYEMYVWNVCELFVVWVFVSWLNVKYCEICEFSCETCINVSWFVNYECLWVDLWNVSWWMIVSSLLI
jgi:hypothetical protein